MEGCKKQRGGQSSVQARRIKRRVKPNEENCAELTGSAIGQVRKPGAQNPAKQEAEYDDG